MYKLEFGEELRDFLYFIFPLTFPAYFFVFSFFLCFFLLIYKKRKKKKKVIQSRGCDNRIKESLILP